MNRKHAYCSLLLLFVLTTLSTAEELTVFPLFSDHGILQQEAVTPPTI